MSKEDLEHYYMLINDARNNPDEIKKIIKQIWEDAQDSFFSREIENN